MPDDSENIEDPYADLTELADQVRIQLITGSSDPDEETTDD